MSGSLANPRASSELNFKIPIFPSILLAAGSGLLVALSVPLFNLFFLAWICFVPLLFVLASPGRTLRGALFYGWIAGTVTCMIGFYWLVGTMVRFGGIPYALATVLFILFGMVSGLSFGLLALLVRFLVRLKAPTVAALPISLVLVESFFPHLFPWQLAMSHYALPVMLQTAEIWGTYGISALLAAAGAIIFERIAVTIGWMEEVGRWRRTIERIGAAAVCLIVLYGVARMEMLHARTQSMPTLKVGIVQPNVSMEVKRDPTQGMKTLWLLQSLSLNLQQRGADLIVWPETSYPFKIPRDQSVDFHGARKISAHTSVPIIIGAVSFGEGHYYNSTYLVTPDERLVGPSDKVNLVLFGEHNPFAGIVPRFITEKYPAAGREGMRAGPAPVLLEYGRLRAGILNCFEDILSDYTTWVVREGANLLVNVTNDAWFGDTSEPYQHLALSVLRTIENRRELVRSVNTGVSAAIDLAGKIVYESATFTQEIEIVEVRLSDLWTPYQRTGNMLGWVSFVAVAVYTTVGFLRGRKGGTRNEEKKRERE